MTGFSLVEVCLAILVVGLGVMVVFGLFPMGLRAVEDASSDTRVAFFAQQCFFDLRGAAGTITNYDDWLDAGVPSRLAGSNYALSVITASAFPPPPSNVPQTNWVRYRLNITPSLPLFPPPGPGTAIVWAASLEVRAGRVWGTNQFDINDSPLLFYTEFPFLGM